MFYDGPHLSIKNRGNLKRFCRHSWCPETAAPPAGNVKQSAVFGSDFMTAGGGRCNIEPEKHHRISRIGVQAHRPTDSSGKQYT